MRASNLGFSISDDGTQEYDCSKGMLGGRNVWMGLSRERYVIRVLLYARGRSNEGPSEGATYHIAVSKWEAYCRIYISRMKIRWSMFQG